MKGTILYGPHDVRFEERDTPRIIEPTDAIIRISATCVCGSDLWPYRGMFPEPSPMGHEYCGIIEEVGSAVTSVKPGRKWRRVTARWTSAARSRPYFAREACPAVRPSLGSALRTSHEHLVERRATEDRRS